MTDFTAAVETAERAQLITDLKAARRELVKRGRCRNELVEDGKVCVLGAVGVATTEGFISLDGVYRIMVLNDPRPRRVRAALEDKLGGRNGGWVEAFNDDETITDQDVLDLFDKTLADIGGLA